MPSSSSSSSANPRLPCPSTLLCNMPDGVRAVVLDERAARIAAVKRDLPLAIASGRRDAVDRVIGPVRRLVRAKVTIDHDDRVALISVAYPAIFSAGVPVNELLADLCADLVRIVPRLRPDAIELDWVPLLESIWNLCDEVEEGPSLNISGSSRRLNVAGSLISLADDGRRHFSRDADQAIAARLMPYLNPSQKVFFRALGLLAVFLPIRKGAVGTAALADQLLQASTWIDTVGPTSAAFLSILSRVARSCAYDWTPHLPGLYTRFIHSLNLPVDGVSHSQRVVQWPGSVRLLLSRSGGHSRRKSLAKYFARIVVATLDASNVHLFGHLTRTLSTFYHPSNYGSSWAPGLSSFLGEASFCFAKQRGISDAAISTTFTTSMIALARLALLSKSSSLSSAGIRALRLLAFADPEGVSDAVADVADLTLMSPTSRADRRLSALRLMTSAAPVIDLPLPLLQVSIGLLDPNDPSFSRWVMRLFTILFQCARVSEATDARVAADEDTMFALHDHLLHFFVRSGEYQKKSADDVTMLSDVRRLMTAFYAAMPTDLYRICARRILNHVMSSAATNARRFFGAACSAASFVDPAWCLGLFVPALSSALKHDSGHKEWLVYLMSCVVRRTGTALLAHMDDVASVIDLLACDDSVRVRSFANKLVRNVLLALTDIYVCDLSPGLLPGTPEDLSIRWHVPSESEVEAARDLAQGILSQAAAVLESGTDSEATIRALLRVRSVIRGAPMHVDLPAPAMISVAARFSASPSVMEHLVQTVSVADEHDVWHGHVCRVRPLLVQAAEVHTFRRYRGMLPNRNQDHLMDILSSVLSVIHVAYPRVYLPAARLVVHVVSQDDGRPALDLVLAFVRDALLGANDNDVLRTAFGLLLIHRVLEVVCDDPSAYLERLICIDCNDAKLQAFVNAAIIAIWTLLLPSSTAIPVARPISSLHWKQALAAHSLRLVCCPKVDDTVSYFTALLLSSASQHEFSLALDAITSLCSAKPEPGAGSTFDPVCLEGDVDSELHCSPLEGPCCDDAVPGWTTSVVAKRPDGYRCLPEAYAGVRPQWLHSWALEHRSVIANAIETHRHAPGMKHQSSNSIADHSRRRPYWPASRGRAEIASSLFSARFVAFWASVGPVPPLDADMKPSSSHQSTRTTAATRSEMWASLTNDGGSDQLLDYFTSSTQQADPEAYPEWASAFRYACSRSGDPRRSMWLIKPVLEMAFPLGYESASTTTALHRFQIQLVGLALAEFGWRARALARVVLRRVGRRYLHVPSKTIRSSIACTVHLAMHGVITPEPSHRSDCGRLLVSRPEDDPALREFLGNVVKACAQSRDDDESRVSSLVFSSLLPALLEHGVGNSNNETASHARHAVNTAAWMMFGADEVAPVIDCLVTTCRASSSARTRRCSLGALRRLVSRHGLLLSPPLIQSLFTLILDLVDDPELDVRVAAAQTLTAVHLATTWCQERISLDALITRFGRVLDSAVAGDTRQDVFNRHGATLGLIALLRSAAYDVPPWLPAVLSLLARRSHERDPVGSAIRKAFLDWKHMHQDDWHSVRSKLPEEQLDVILDIHCASSYFV
ncbi:unnamed protein product (mitochondrion) [Plasmodiophora brassicae]|uniref:Proteasome activator complex subunit 4 C-terminal domain-containing protein n=1 Tax=Plasmodiophora brassicae TaxID=37360 RepID=A0A3P3YFZ1_PLABS|nr:unnamed protein product [Plasmodiophora brassicae]